MSNDWIHTRRGATLVEGTLPKLARGIEALTAELKRYNDRADDDETAHFRATKQAGKAKSDTGIVVECMVRVTDKEAAPYGWVGQVSHKDDWRWNVVFTLPDGNTFGDWFEPHQIERLTLAAAEQYIRVLHEDRVKAAKKRAKPLTYEEGCICPSCVMRRESEAIANEPELECNEDCAVHLADVLADFGIEWPMESFEFKGKEEEQPMNWQGGLVTINKQQAQSAGGEE